MAPTADQAGPASPPARECASCGGRGYLKDPDNECLHCDGTGLDQPQVAEEESDNKVWMNGRALAIPRCGTKWGPAHKPWSPSAGAATKGSTEPTTAQH